MSYTKITTSFKDHETVLTAAHLQHLENGISDNDAALVNRVRTDTNAQGLETSQKRNARANIDVPSTAEMTAAVAAEADLRSAADTALETKTDSIQNEVDQAKGNINDLQSLSASMTKLKTVSGNPVVIHDALAGKIHKLVIPLSPKQDMHGYEKPWIGGTGKNLLPPLETGGTVFNVALTNGEDGSIIASGTASKSGGRANSYAKTKPFVLKAGTYITSNESASSTKVQVVVQTANGTAISGGTNTPFTVTEDTEVTVGYNLTEGTIYDGKPQYIQLEAGSATTRFEPYSNVCPIEGYDSVEITSTGKNWLNMVMTAREANGIRFEPQANGLVKLSGTSTAFASRNSELFSLPVGKYTVVSEYRVNGESIGYDATCDVVIREEGASTNLVANFGSFEVTNPNQQYFLRIGLSTGKTVPANFEAGAMICKADNVASSYEPFGQSLSISLTSATGSTVYGGTLTLNEDGSGTVVVDRATVTLSGITAPMGGYSTNTKTHYITAVVAPGMKVTDYTLAFDGICDRFESYPGTPGWQSTTKPYIGFGPGENFRFSIPGVTDFSTALEYINGSQVTYAFATPKTYTLSFSQLSTLLGTTNVLTDTDAHLTLTYKADKYGNISDVYSAFPEESVSPEDIVTVTDGANDIPVKELTIAVEPKQDLNGYDRPWVGGAGKNLLPDFDQSGSSHGITWKVNDDKTVTVNGTATETVTIDAPTGVWQWDGNTDCWLSGCPSGGNYVEGYSLRADANYSSSSFSTPDTGVGVKLQSNNSTAPIANYNLHYRIVIRSGITCRNLIFRPQLELGNKKTTYEPYSNICPISGWDGISLIRAGKNLLDTSMIRYGYYVPTQSGGIGYTANDNYRSIDVDLPAGTYIFSTNMRSAFFVRRFIDNVEYQLMEEGQSNTFTLEKPSHVRFTVRNTSTSAIESGIKLQLECGEEVTSFEPYKQTSIFPIFLSTITGSTVYGGTVKIYEDGTGEVVVDKGIIVFSGNEEITRVGSSPFAFRYALPKEASTKEYDTTCCSHFKYSLTDGYAGISAGEYMITSTKDVIAFCLPRLGDTENTIDTIKQYLAEQYQKGTPITVVYSLVPKVYSFTAEQIRTLLGFNTVWSDAGKVSIVYRADTGLLIDKLLTAITAYGITV